MLTMKHLLVTGMLCILLAACSKKDIQSAKTDITIDQTAKSESCDFGISGFNLTKREALNEVIILKNPHQGGGGSTGGGGTTPPATSSGVIYLDFNGQLVSGTSWNGGSSFTCAPANLSSATVNSIIDRVTNDYAPFNVTVTGDEAVYNAAPANRRMRVILTESWEWFGQAGGTSFVGSFTWGNNTPCFVFTSLLNYNEKSIGEAASHESGHTFGLHHQSTYSGTTLINQYNPGSGSGETGWAPIMGYSYGQNLSLWHNGQTNLGYSSYEDEVAMISNIVGMRTDDFSNTQSGATTLTTSTDGYINSSSDVDFFSVNLSTSKNLSVVPYNVGANNNGANQDIVLKVYSTSGILIATFDNPAALSASGVLNPGQYFVSVSATANAYANTYGMIGRYSISLN